MNNTATIVEVKRFAVHDGPGVRTVIFLKGCPLHCLWCHNPESISASALLAYYEHKCLHCGECVAVCPNGAHRMDGELHRFDRSKCTACGACFEECLGRALTLFGTKITVDEAVRAVMEDRDFYRDGGGVTLSGGEPLCQADFCRELLEKLKGLEIHTAVDTCGCVPWSVYEKVLPYTDMFLFDFKHSDSEEHRKLTGQPNERIIDNLSRLSALRVDIEIRIPLIPGCNDSDKNLYDTGKILSVLNIKAAKVLPYHSMARSKYAALGIPDTMPQVETPEAETVKHAEDILFGEI